MSDANAKSSKKVTSFKEEVEEIKENLKIVMGPFSAVLNDKEYTLKMEQEYARTYTEQLMELAIPVGTYTKTVNKNGEIIARVSDKTGKRLDVKSRTKTAKKENEK